MPLYPAAASLPPTHPPVSPSPCCACSDITERHRRLAEISEMLHTASLVHDDVLDECDTRRGGWAPCSAVLGQPRLPSQAARHFWRQPAGLAVSQQDSRPACHTILLAWLWSGGRQGWVWLVPRAGQPTYHTHPWCLPASHSSLPLPLPPPSLCPPPLSTHHLNFCTAILCCCRQGHRQQPVWHARCGAGGRLPVCAVILVPGQPGQHGGGCC